MHLFASNVLHGALTQRPPGSRSQRVRIGMALAWQSMACTSNMLAGWTERAAGEVVVACKDCTCVHFTLAARLIFAIRLLLPWAMTWTLRAFLLGREVSVFRDGPFKC